MTYKSINIKLWILAFISGGSFILFATLTKNGHFKSFDLQVIHWVQSFEMPFLTTLFKTFTTIGSGYVVAIITLVSCFILFFFFHEQRKAIIFTSTIIITMLSNAFIKSIYERERPQIYRIMDASGHSFPSGHTMMAVSLYTMLIYAVWHRLQTTQQRVAMIVIAYFIASIIAVSRIYVGVHYPTDIIGGILCSTCILSLLFIINQWILRSKLPF